MDKRENLKLLFPHLLWEEAKKLHSVGERHYHTFEHALDVLEAVTIFHHEVGFVDLEAALLAALFHDAVYEVRDPLNETLSAIALRTATSKYYPDITIPTLARAQMLIEATAHHMAQDLEDDSWDAILFMDADMFQFASNFEKFKLTNEKIDREFMKGIPADKYLESRISFFKAMNEKGVFRAPPNKRRYEETAQGNILRMLHELGAYDESVPDAET